MYLRCLIKPEEYYETQIQSAIEHLWPCLFDKYRLLDRKQIKMPSEWRPDIVAVHKDEKESYLIIELKAKPPSGTREKAINQVIGYAKWFHEEHPFAFLRLMVIGSYNQNPNIESRDEYDIGVIQLSALATYLLSLAERTLLWHANNPVGEKPEALKILDTIASLLKATTSIDEENNDENGGSDINGNDNNDH